MNKLEEKFRALNAIPEVQWVERRKLAQELIISEVDQSKIRLEKLNLEGSNYLHLLFFDYDNESFVYFEKITPSYTPTIHWFQIEKKDNRFGESVLRTDLLLASDDLATTQGAAFYNIFY